MKSVAVIGAGISGLRTAQVLAQNGFKVTVFDKGSTVGGRICTRSDRSGELHHPLNYGAQVVYGTAMKNSPQFRATVNSGLHYSASKGLPAGWGDEKQYIDSKKRSSVGNNENDRIKVNLNFDWIVDDECDFDGINGFIFQPGMSTLPKLMAQQALSLGVSIHTSTLVENIVMSDAKDNWIILTKNVKSNSEGVKETKMETFEHVVVAVPSPQASSLLSSSNYDNRDAYIKDLSKVVYDPCWVVMLSFSGFPFVPFENQAVIKNPSPNIYLITNESSRITDPDVLPNISTFTVLASPSWSRENLEESNKKVEESLVSELRKTSSTKIPADAKILSQRSHRWRYSQVAEVMQTSLPFLYDERAKIGLCGDFFLGPNIEHAFDSGDQLARQIVNSSRKSD